MPDLDQLDRAAAAAEQRAAKAREAAAAEQHRRDQARQARLDAYDRQRLSRYDDLPLEEQVMAAKQALAEAVAADPVVQAAAAYVAAQVQRSKAASWASNAATLLGVPSPVTSSPPASFVNVNEVVSHTISALAADLGQQADEREHAEREQAGEAG